MFVYFYDDETGTAQWAEVDDLKLMVEYFDLYDLDEFDDKEVVF